MGRPRVLDARALPQAVGVRGDAGVLGEGGAGALREEEGRGEADVGEGERVAGQERPAVGEVVLEVLELLVCLIDAFLKRLLHTRTCMSASTMWRGAALLVGRGGKVRGKRRMAQEGWRLWRTGLVPGWQEGCVGC